MAATWLVVVGGNDIAWRAEWPAAAVGGRVAKIPEGTVLRYPNSDSPLPWTLIGRDPASDHLHVATNRQEWEALCDRQTKLVGLQTVFPAQEGAAVFVRPDIERAALALQMRQQGIRTIAETDDNYFCDASQNLFLRQQRADDLTREAHARSMAACAVNVFSTAVLRDRYAKEYRQRFGKANTKQVEMHVCRNHLPHRHWPVLEPYDGPVRFGFMGSPSHVWDVNLAYAAFHAAKAEGCETWMVGYNPADPDPDQPETVSLDDGSEMFTHSEKSRWASGKWAKVVDRHVRWITPNKFHRTPLPFDIGICPLWYNDFTTSKSDSKALELTASGAAVVCANNPAYTAAGWRNEVNCLLANSPEEYAVQTVRLIRDPGLRRGLVEAAQQMVREERSDRQLREEWSVALAL